MTDATKQALEAFILQTIEAAKTGAQWTAEQTPLLVQEWLRWQLIQEAAFFIVLVGIAVAFGKLSRVCWDKKRADKHSDWEVGGAVFMFLSGIFAILTVVSLTFMAKVIFAPRVVVFEKFMELVK